MTIDATSLLVADWPAVDGLTLRRFRDRADYVAMAELTRAATLHDGEDYVPDAGSLEADYEHMAGLVPRRDIVIAEVHGTPVAWAVAFRQVRDGLAVYQSVGVVHPDWRRRSIGRALLGANERHARRLAAGFDDPAGRAHGSWCGEREGGAKELLAAAGYAPVRFVFTMRRPHLGDLPAATLPADLEIREVREEDRRAIWLAENEAFRDHWGHREQTDEDFAALLAQPDLDTSLWSVAWDGDEVVGSVQSFVWKAENEALGVRRGWLERISVRRPWRRRGVARAIIVDALGRLRLAGMDEAMLGVDSENPTGALQLYESLGFEVQARGATYRKAWEPGGRLV